MTSPEALSAPAAGTPASLPRLPMLAVIPVREGALPAGADEAVAECGGHALLVGEHAAAAAAALEVAAAALWAAEAGGYAPAAWSAALAPLLAAADVLVLPASPDGRDLAPRLAASLDRPLWTQAVSVGPGRVRAARAGGRALVESALPDGAVVTLLPGVAGVVARPPEQPLPPVTPVAVVVPAAAHDAEVLRVLPPDAATMDLAESPRVFAGGAGLASPAAFGLLQEVAARLGASMGATRVVADLDWVPFARQIGTTGTAIDPRLYVALGISGAVQHITGIGDPEHVIAVNTDPSCPMMARADLAVVADAPATLAELASLLGVAVPPGGAPAAGHGTGPHTARPPAAAATAGGRGEEERRA